ncbi:hypothetical protein F5Y19DRAFT_50497 [Xylariaceae sp. FL1651]|nr:hypothetical protein F5Y19DRAFT_50497 [Xylariaceae sp. FL1651]
MPARRSSKSFSSAVTSGVVPDEDEPPRKRSKGYDEDRISADIRAVYPNWTPADPQVLVKHGFVGSPSLLASSPLPSSSSGRPQELENPQSQNQQEHHPVQAIFNGGDQDQHRNGGSGQEHSAARGARGGGQGRGRGAKAGKAREKDRAAAAAEAAGKGQVRAPPQPPPPPSTPIVRRRNASHNLPEISQGAYAAFLDRHGQRPEHFPHALLRRLEGARRRRQQQQRKRACSASPSSPPPPPPSSEEGFGPGGADAGRKDDDDDDDNNNNNDAAHVWVVAHTQYGGYGGFRHVQAAGTDSCGAGSGMRLHGVFARLEDANVRAMEVFQKLHRDFMLCGQASGSASGLGFGLGPNGLGFLELEAAGGNGDGGSVAATNSSFAERHPLATAARGGGMDVGGDDGNEGASWWLDAAGCLSLRAANWGTGNSRIFVVKQELCC